MSQNAQTPVLLFGFANDQQNYLRLLQEESHKIWKLFRDLERDNLLKVIREESLTNQELVDYLIYLRPSIQMLHFAGHAGNNTLFTEDDPSDPRGIGAMLKHFDKIKLVVLNACETDEQVQIFLNAGVPVVIATSLPVADRHAFEFARLFYLQIANGDSVKVAFETTIAALASNSNWAYGAFAEVEVVEYNRSLGLRSESNSADNLPPWKIFIREDAKDDYQRWSLLPAGDELDPGEKLQQVRLKVSNLDEIMPEEKTKAYLEEIISLYKKKIEALRAGEDISEFIRDKRNTIKMLQIVQQSTDNRILGRIIRKTHDQVLDFIEQASQIKPNEDLTDEDRSMLLKQLEESKAELEDFHSLLYDE